MDTNGSSYCENLGKILKGKGMMEDNVCMVTIERNDIEATIGNRPYHSLHHMFHFERADSNGNALITGELVLTENEVQRLVTDITNAGIIVSALHNHWIYDDPRLYYIHVETVMNPATFANVMSRIIFK